jgi:ribosomal protein S18 acetylase RimI-like enzyme
MRLDLPLVVEIRPLRHGDLDDLEWDSYRAVSADYVRATVAERPEQVVFLLALVDGQPVGRLGVDFGRKASEGIVHLWAFSVLPVLQRRGIGTALMRKAEALIASSPGASIVEVGVDDWNTEAAKLYRRLGYVESGSELGDKGETLVLLRKPIRP